ncbi:MAG TPA: hypothetical protein VFP80_05300, partial [Thermoanaerobaculia bacterium]|nr:hypothetical protein [Thermoanaerobaculia bacterium]
LPLTALETRGSEIQRTIADDAECGDAMVFAPLFACAEGTATAGVPVTAGATYSWSVEGAAIVDGAGTPRVSLDLGAPGNVKLTCVVTTAECSRIAGAVIAVREPIAITQLALPQTATTNEPLTITWTYGASAPTSQLLAGDALEAPVALPGDARSYTFTPAITGSRTIELRASYFTAMSDGAPKSRRRAAGRSVATASDCTLASSTGSLLVKGCNTIPPRIKAPTSVDAGSTFEARVTLEEDEQARWTVDNGTVVDTNADTGRAVIRAGATGEVELSVVVSLGACTRSSSATASVIPAAKQCDVSPVATLAYVSHGCSGAVVSASFTGTPPFRGTWSDGSSFETHQSSLQHTFAAAGTYGITGFRDASCTGIVSGAPRVDALRAKAKLEVIGAGCTTGKLVAKLTGTPPFTFKWVGPWPINEWVTTNDREVVRDLQPGHAGTWLIEAVSDAVCSQQSSSNPVTITQAPTGRVLPGPMCQYDDFDPANLWVFLNGRPPYSVTWSDGVTTTSSTSPILRTVPKPNAPLVEYRIVQATANGCAVELENDTATVSYRPPPRIDTDELAPLICPGETATATLKSLPAPGAQILWTVPGGEILSGQGTPTITYRSKSVTDSLIRADAVYPDGSCSTFDHATQRFHGISEPANVKLNPATIAPGGSAVLSFTIDQNVNSIAAGVSPAARQKDLQPLHCNSGVCQVVYKDTTGPGTVTLELQYWGHCMTGGYKTVFTTLTIQ